MPSTIVTTIGAANANSYIDIAGPGGADAYFDDQLNVTKWTNASTADKTRALLTAATRLQDENWLGNRVTTTQRLAWPRLGVAKVDQVGGWGFGGFGYGGSYGYQLTQYYLSTEIPQAVKDAQCELALVYLSGGSGLAAGSIESFDLDGLRVDLSGESAAGADDSRVRQLIAGLVGGNELVRG